MFFTVVLCQFFAFSGLPPLFFVQGLQFNFGRLSVPCPLLHCSIHTFSSNDQCYFKFLIRQGIVIFPMRIFGGSFELCQFFVDNFELTFLHFRFSASYFLPSFNPFPIRVKVFEFVISISK